MILLGIQFWPRQPCGGGLVIATLWARPDGSLVLRTSAEDGEVDHIPLTVDDLPDVWDAYERAEFDEGGRVLW